MSTPPADPGALRTLYWESGSFFLLDQRLLPEKITYLQCRSVNEVAKAIREMAVRGAPAIGVSAAYGMALAARAGGAAAVKSAALKLRGTRPTAVNLHWAVERMESCMDQAKKTSDAALAHSLLLEAHAICKEDLDANRRIGAWGEPLIPDGASVLTHCNAGALATAGYGTALGVIRAAFEQGKRIQVIANETRPFLQGARLTAYELAKEGIPVTVACDNAVGHLMKKGMVQKVVVGADRIAANGDAANKIGTYTVALAAKAHGVPFYVAAPASTFDLTLASGELIPIENRTPREVTHVGEHRITPEGVPVYNFAFDVTPANLIAGIITEKGVLTAPYTDAIRAAIGGK